MSLSTPIDPRALWPLSYLSGRLGYQLTGYGITGPDRDVVSLDLERDGTDVHVDWFPRTSHILVSRGDELLGAYTSFPALAEALEALPAA